MNINENNSSVADVGNPSIGGIDEPEVDEKPVSLVTMTTVYAHYFKFQPNYFFRIFKVPRRPPVL